MEVPSSQPRNDSRDQRQGRAEREPRQEVPNDRTQQTTHLLESQESKPFNLRNLLEKPSSMTTNELRNQENNRKNTRDEFQEKNEGGHGDLRRAQWQNDSRGYQRENNGRQGRSNEYQGKILQSGDHHSRSHKVRSHHSDDKQRKVDRSQRERGRPRHFRDHRKRSTSRKFYRYYERSRTRNRHRSPRRHYHTKQHGRRNRHSSREKGYSRGSIQRHTYHKSTYERKSPGTAQRYHKGRARYYEPDYKRKRHDSQRSFRKSKRSRSRSYRRYKHTRRSLSADHDYSYSRSRNRRYRKRPSYSSESEGSSVGSGASSAGSDAENGDAGHYKYQIGGTLKNYKIISFLGDGTFGRCLKCLNQEDNKYYAVKIIRSVKRYNESAKIEANILEDIRKKGGAERGIVFLREAFSHKQENGDEHMCLVFETLGASLYDFLKNNNYKGFPIAQIQSFARQTLSGLAFLRSIDLTHTDLKPENILLKHSDFESIADQKLWPLQVKHKKEIFGQQKCESDSESMSSGSDTVKEGPRNKKQRGIWKKTIDDEIKIIDFGGATYANEHHTALINTRQYRAPEVILGCSKWDEKSDIWSLACIFAELYTGEMFFPTHENIEHLALMEKTCGPLPYWMASNAKDEFKQCFDLKRSEETIQTRKMRLKWPEAAKKKDSYNNWLDQKTLGEIIMHESSSDHKAFKEFLEFMFQQDPKKRPSANDCAKHPFFQLQIKDETKRVENQAAEQGHRQESKSTEKTRGSTSHYSPQSYSNTNTNFQ